MPNMHMGHNNSQLDVRSSVSGYNLAMCGDYAFYTTEVTKLRKKGRNVTCHARLGIMLLLYCSYHNAMCNSVRHDHLPTSYIPESLCVVRVSSMCYMFSYS